MMGGPPRRGADEVLAKIFGKNTSFTATARVAVADPRGTQLQSVEVAYAMLDGKLRTETDVSKMKDAQMPPDAVEHVRQMGMDRTVFLMLPEKATAYIIYPGMKAYVEQPTGSAGNAKKTDASKIEKTELGKETIDGRPCVKNKVIISDPDGDKTETVVWEATDLSNFPVQTQVREPDATITTRFSDIRLAKPDASLFELPTGFKRYGNMQELMMGVMQQMMQGMPPPQAAPPVAERGK